MQKINSIEELDHIIGLYFRPKCITNTYFLISSLHEFINNNNLWYTANNSNLILIIEKGHFYQIYFYLNQLNDNFMELSVQPAVIEIPYREKDGKPVEILTFWKNHGFDEHLSRYNYMLNYTEQMKFDNMASPYVEVKFANTEKELLFTKELYDSSLDKYTSDRLSMERLNYFMERQNLLCSYYKGELAGALQFEVKNNIVWLGHIAVHNSFRGKGVARALVLDYLNLNIRDGFKRFSLWVVQNNTAAISLYEHFGFTKSGKSTVSMLKL